MSLKVDAKDESYTKIKKPLQFIKLKSINEERALNRLEKSKKNSNRFLTDELNPFIRAKDSKRITANDSKLDISNLQKEIALATNKALTSIKSCTSRTSSFSILKKNSQYIQSQKSNTSLLNFEENRKKPFGLNTLQNKGYKTKETTGKVYKNLISKSVISKSDTLNKQTHNFDHPFEVLPIKVKNNPKTITSNPFNFSSINNENPKAKKGSSLHTKTPELSKVLKKENIFVNRVKEATKKLRNLRQKL